MPTSKRCGRSGHHRFLGLAGGTNPKQSWVFLPALGAYGLLIFAILIKNVDGANK